MKYEAVKNILPREQPEVIEILEKFSKIIEDAVNFGTHLMKWETERKLCGDSEIVPLLFMRNILEIADGISILIKNSSIETAKTSLRSLLENVFGLQYLLEENTINRSLSFLVWTTHRDLKFYEKLDAQTQIGKQFNAELKKDKLITDTEFITNIEYLQAKLNSEELLKLPIYRDIETEYQLTNSKTKNPNWYSLYSGPKNVENLAKHLKHNGIYEVMYRSFSHNVHSTDIYKGKLLPNINGTVDLIQIRSPKDSQSITIDTINFLLMAYLSFYKKRIPEKNTEFMEWYNEFRVRYSEIRNKKNQIIYE
jgi:Family of unknown function (DUF5677)